VLGQDVLLGRRIFDRAGSFTIAIGPTTWSVMERFRAGGDLLALTAEVVAWLVRDPLDWLVAITLLPREAPGLQLSASGCLAWGGAAGSAPGEETVLVVDPQKPERHAAS
jgi:predicted component of type VI protein secretion system